MALAELAVRLSGAGEGRASMLLAPSEHPDLDYVLVPGASSRRVSINSHGFRDGELEIVKPPGTRRIVVVGDSVTFGMGLAAEQTFSEQLEALFASTGAPTEVLNLGVSGYDVVNEVAFLEVVGLRFDPDVVVLGFCINDVGIHSANLRAVELAHRRGWLLAHSQLARFVVRRLEGRRLETDLHELNQDDEFRRRYAGRIDSLDDDTEQLGRLAALRSELAALGTPLAFAEWYASEAKIGRLRHSFARLAGLSRRRGFEAWVAVLPYLDEAGHPGIYRRVYAIVRHEAERQRLSVLLLRDPLAAAGMETLMSLRGETLDPIHPNAAGHRLIAEALHEALGATSREPPRGVEARE